MLQPTVQHRIDVSICHQGSVRFTVRDIGTNAAMAVCAIDRDDFSLNDAMPLFGLSRLPPQNDSFHAALLAKKRTLWRSIKLHSGKPRQAVDFIW